MEQTKIKETTDINIKPIIVITVLLFIALQIGFHPTYFKYFPEFKKFTWLHHIHGALMASWIMLLAIQPILIYKRKYDAHRFFGKLSYISAPIMIISMCLILNFSYHKAIVKHPLDKILAVQSTTMLQLFNFTTFYLLAILNKKNTFYHMRYMIGTALVFFTPILSRLLGAYFEIKGEYPLFLSISLAAIFLIIDIRKKQHWIPNTIVLAGLVLALFIHLSRNTAAWQMFGKFVANNFY